MAAKVKARFIDPMLLLRTDSLQNDGDRWEYQLKFDGYRAIAFKTGGKIYLRSRNDNDFSIRYSAVVKGLAKLPDETVIDGEVIALDDDGRPSFNILQNYGSSKAAVFGLHGGFEQAHEQSSSVYGVGGWKAAVADFVKRVVIGLCRAVAEINGSASSN